MPSNFEHRVHTGFDKREKKYFGLPLQWASIVGNNEILKSTNRPLPLVDPSEITPTEILDLKTIVRPHNNNNNNSSSVPETQPTQHRLALPKTSHVARSNSLRSSSPPRVRRGDLRANANVPTAVPEEIQSYPYPEMQMNGNKGQYPPPTMMPMPDAIDGQVNPLHLQQKKMMTNGSMLTVNTIEPQNPMNPLQFRKPPQHSPSSHSIKSATNNNPYPPQMKAKPPMPNTSNIYPPHGHPAMPLHMQNQQQPPPHIHHPQQQQQQQFPRQQPQPILGQGINDQNLNPQLNTVKASSRASSSSAGNSSLSPQGMPGQPGAAAGSTVPKQEQRLTHEQVSLYLVCVRRTVRERCEIGFACFRFVLRFLLGRKFLEWNGGKLHVNCLSRNSHS